MEVKVAKTAGFCFGVQRAVDKVYELIGSHPDKLFTLGPIIHNEEVVNDLEKKGVRVASEEDLKTLPEGSTVVIRSHGVGKEVYDRLEEYGLSYVDVTCPFVLKIHRIVEKESRAGSHVVIIGDPDHPEVVGICGWCMGPCTVIKTEQDALDFVPPPGKNICIVSQTTFNYNKFKDLVEIIMKKSYDVSVLNTICNATKERQTEAESIAESVDAMIVIGDKHSSNTQKLVEICRKACDNTYYIQTLDDLDLNQLGSVETVGITAGASTPNNIIEEVQNNVRIIF